MSALEKLFVFLVVIFGMFIMFLFGMYFDVGDMFVAAFAFEEPATQGGQGERMIDRMYRLGRRRLGDVTDLPFGGTGTNDGVEISLTREEEERLSGKDQVLKDRDKGELVKAQLKARGFTREEFLEMEALGAQRGEFSRALKEVKVLVGLDQREEAIEVLERALSQVPARNYLVRQDILAYLVRLHYDLQDLENAKARSTELYQLLDRIITVKRLALAEKDSPTIRSQIAQLVHEKDRLDVLHQYVSERVAKTGSRNGMTDEEKAMVLKTLDSALQAGKVTRAEYDETVQNLNLGGGV